MKDTKQQKIKASWLDQFKIQLIVSIACKALCNIVSPPPPKKENK